MERGRERTSLNSLLPGLAVVLLAAPVCLCARPVMAQQESLRRTGVLEQIKPDEPMTLVFPTWLHVWGIQKGEETYLRLLLGGRTSFDNPQGIAVTVLDAWDDPGDEADDDEVTVYGVNSGRGEIIYNTSMVSLGLYGSRGRGIGQFRSPHGIDADPVGNLVVADTGNDRIAVLFNNGRILSHITYLTAAAPGDSFAAPYDVALVPDGSVWISDTGRSRLVRQSLTGETLDLIDLGDRLGEPGAIALAHPEDRWSYFREYALFVAGRSGEEIVKLGPDGEIAARVTAADVGRSTMQAAYMTVDFYANLWVTDRHGHCLHKFDRNLNHLATFGRRGRGRKEFEGPRGLDIWPRFGQMFVSETRSAQYYWVGADVAELQAVQEGATLRLAYHLTEYAYLTVRVRYRGGGLEELSRRRFRTVGQRSDSYELTQDRPLIWVEVTVEPTYSSYTYREKVYHLRLQPGGGR